MSYVTPAQLKSGLQGAKDYADSKGAGFTKAHIVGTTALAADWLSDTAGGTALIPDTESVYVIQTAGDYFGNLYMWNGTEYYPVGGDSSEGGSTSIMHVYIVGDKQYRNDWLGETADGAALNPQSDVVYVIETQGDYFGQMYYWNGTENVYRLMGKKNLGNDPAIIGGYGTETKSFPGEYGYSGTVDVVSIPVKLGDVLHVNISGWLRSYDLFIGFDGDTTVSQSITLPSMGGDYSYLKDIVITEELAALNVPFVFRTRAYGYTGQIVRVYTGEIVVDKAFHDYETPLFVPPTSEAAGKAGLVPGPAAGTTNRVLTQDGWDETPLDITSEEIKEAFDEVSGGSSDMLPNEYSTEERMIGHWIDGKPLYRKTVICSALTNNGRTTIPHGITDIAEITNMTGGYWRGSNAQFIPIHIGATQDNQYQLRSSVEGRNIIIDADGDYSTATHGHVTLEYTKTTD